MSLDGRRRMWSNPSISVALIIKIRRNALSASMSEVNVVCCPVTLASSQPFFSPLVVKLKAGPNRFGLYIEPGGVKIACFHFLTTIVCTYCHYYWSKINILSFEKAARKFGFSDVEVPSDVCEILNCFLGCWEESGREVESLKSGIERRETDS